MKEPPRDDIARVILDGPSIDRAIMAARRRVVRRHLRAGVPLAVWKDGRVVHLQPDSAEVIALMAQDGDDI